MLFSSVEFLFRFLPVFMLLYLIVPARYRNFVLLAGSLVFYGVGEPYFVLLLIFSVVVNYGISKYMFWEPAAPIQN
ncbi:MAG: MBOAT family protein, partial [Lachnospiraceae bacterium]|nr:MBOAT family protein [Lachnospiraceae bacterium]